MSFGDYKDLDFYVEWGGKPRFEKRNDAIWLPLKGDRWGCRGGRVDLRVLEQRFKEIAHMEHLIQSLMQAFFLDNFYAFFFTGVWLLYPLEKGMATHPSILTWRIPWTEEPSGLWSTGSQRVRHDWVINTFTLSIALQCHIHFCCTMKWISYLYAYICSVLDLSDQ